MGCETWLLAAHTIVDDAERGVGVCCHHLLEKCSPCDSEVSPYRTRSLPTRIPTIAYLRWTESTCRGGAEESSITNGLIIIIGARCKTDETDNGNLRQPDRSVSHSSTFPQSNESDAANPPFPTSSTILMPETPDPDVWKTLSLI